MAMDCQRCTQVQNQGRRCCMAGACSASRCRPQHTRQPESMSRDVRACLLACRWKAGELSGSNAQLRSPVPSCHYLVDHRRGVIFVRTTKIGGTTLANTLGITNNPVACRYLPPACLPACLAAVRGLACAKAAERARAAGWTQSDARIGVVGGRCA